MANIFITGKAFLPEEGKKYDVHFGRIRYRGEDSFVSARIFISGNDWFDEDTATLLDEDLRKYAVQAFREI
jgi:hypothetical protein